MTRSTTSGALVYTDDDLNIVICNDRERDGLRVLVDLSKQDRWEAIKILEEVLAQLKS